MKHIVFKKQLFNLLNQNVGNMKFDEKMKYVGRKIIEFERRNENSRDISNNGKKWTDEELELILSDGATETNCLRYAKLFKRGYGSIELIHRWARTPNNMLSDKQKNNSFIKQIKKVARDIGFRG
jgi:hypothetical protein